MKRSSNVGFAEHLNDSCLQIDNISKSDLFMNIWNSSKVKTTQYIQYLRSNKTKKGERDLLCIE